MDIRERIELDPAVMGGRPCVRGTRVTVSTLIGLLAAGHERGEILSLYPYITAEDITAALSHTPRGGPPRLHHRELGNPV